jgi:hypothetical protein
MDEALLPMRSLTICLFIHSREQKEKRGDTISFLKGDMMKSK